MDTNRLKRFAQEARNILMTGVAHRVNALGFDMESNADQAPVLMDGGSVFMGEIMPIDFYYQWKSLQANIIERGAKQVIEEAAYTWFNRLVAIRILAKNRIISPVLEYDSSSARIPVIVAEARKGRTPDMDAASKAKLEALLESDALTTEQFTVLIVAFCHANPILNACFGRITDYTELLLPNNILAENGFIDTLNNTPFISDDDYKSPELIGWLYQFYISERKDEVFAKKGKFEADEIAPATQIFTPNWIVKYMVQNTIGRIYLDNYDYAADDFKPKWKYLVEPSEPTPAEAILRFNSLEELKMGDLACGSGHILNEGFDLLYDLYIYEGYSRTDAVTNILTKNLSGIDLDTRAKQLAQFALLLKACQKDISFADAHCMPRVLDMPKVDRYTWLDLRGHMCCNLEIPSPNDFINNEIEDCFDLMKDADSLGSIMKFDISDDTRKFIQHCIEVQSEKHLYEEQFKELFHAFELILMLTEKYSALVMNPPYMGSTNMNSVLTDYTKYNYQIGKGDLCTAFMLMQAERTLINGLYSNIIPPSWMFITSFEELRHFIINHQMIVSQLHLSRGVFGADFGSVSTVIRNAVDTNAKGIYFRLNERTFQEFEQDHLRVLLEYTIRNHDFRFRFDKYDKNIAEIKYNSDGAKIYYSDVFQKKFLLIPGAPLGYWLSEHWYETFKQKKIEEIVEPKAGIVTGDDKYFVRYWFEICNNDLSRVGAAKGCYSKYHFFYKGGGFRKYYGNGEYVIRLHDLWDPMHYNVSIRRGDEDCYFKKGIGWSQVNSSNIKTFRVIENAVCGTATPTIYPLEKQDFNYILGLLNNRFISEMLKLYNPTINLLSTNICDLPFIESVEYKERISVMVENNISICREDWDAHETSWDFMRNELLTMNWVTFRENLAYEVDKIFRESGEHCEINPVAPEPEKIEWCYKTYCDKWNNKFNKLHHNEEELNKQFIEIYGLQDEITPEVPLDEITILQQGEISIENNNIVWHPDVVMKQLISYAIGCMMGRYSIDKPGLILANHGDGLKEYNRLVPNSSFEIDDDGIIPLMPEFSSFADNATHRFKVWLAAAFGEETVNENLNFIEKCLNKTIDDYLVKDFWKDHKKMYQNRPIYWLFSSAKGAFQCLAYMHRMDAFTPERVRTKYLLPHLEWLKQQYNDMESRSATLSTKERKQMDNIAKQIQECQEYHDILHVVADDHDHLAFDLDDGVVVNYAKFAKVLAKLK